MIELSNEEIQNYFKEAIDFTERAMDFYLKSKENLIKRDIHILRGSIAAERNKMSYAYEFSEKDLKVLEEILNRSLKEEVTITKAHRADMLLLESLILRLDLKVKSDLVDFRKNELNAVKLLDFLRKSEKKFMNQILNDKIKEAINKLEEENKEVNAESISIVANVDIKDCEKYLKKLESVNKARAANPKVK
ncbi:hypothetical protein AB0W38_00470 [Aliarcobacter butzleri]|uniref:hypothetical protein n=1 Tax=Aliarcobacter butzleri TaxID=28197 RepID=UPI00344C903E